MQKYEIRNPIFEGCVEVTYRHGVLAIIDFSTTNLSEGSRIAAIKNLPFNHNDLLAKEWAKGVTCIAVDYEVPFEEFWKLYGHKVGKKNSQALWSKLNNADKLLAIQGIPKWKSFLRYNNWRGQKDPERWLKGRCWEDDVK